MSSDSVSGRGRRTGRALEIPIRKFLGLLLALAGVCYLTNSFVNFMHAGFGTDLFPWILLPCVLAEGALAVWLAIAGVNSSKWYQVAAAQARSS
jgi:hypothetical protein